MFTYIGGMQMTPLPTNAPSRIAEPPGHEAHVALEAERLERHRVLVEERPAPVVDRVIDEAPEPEPEEDSALDPGVHTPARRLRRIGLGRANMAHVELIAKPHECAARRHRVGLIALRE
jgi:hypothetical protein